MNYPKAFLQKKAKEIRKIILELSFEGKKAHISSSLSIADILCVLYWDGLRIERTSKKNRDRLILSKGHAACALYAVLLQKKILSRKITNSYGKNGTLLGVHPELVVPGIEFSTGSLGHGLSVGVGIALAGQRDGQKNKTYVLLSDAECQEGSVWEAAMFAGHHRLDTLVAIIDYNHMQAMGKTKNIINLEPLAEKWRAFGWTVLEIDGHDVQEISTAFSMSSNGKPKVVICNTIAGKGVSFMQDRLEWHYHNLDKQQYNKALREIEKT